MLEAKKTADCTHSHPEEYRNIVRRLKTLSIHKTLTKEEIDAYRKAYNEELYRLVFEDTKDEARARKYVEEHSLGDDEGCAMSMRNGNNPLCLAELEYIYN